MTPEQSLYKILTYFRNKEDRTVGLGDNHFRTTFTLPFTDANYKKCYQPATAFDFNNRTIKWGDKRFDYSTNANVEYTGAFDWDTHITIANEALLRKMQETISYEILKAEQERTRKVRALQTACRVKNELAAIDGMVV